MDLRKRLAALDRLGRRPAAVDDARSAPAVPDRSPAERDAQLAALGLDRRDEPAGPVWYREVVRCVPQPGVASLDGFGGRLAPASIDPGRTLFLDTETTGLMGGTGTLAFMVGLAWWQCDRFHVRQLFLPGPGAEPALLAHLEGLAGNHETIVTFNGAAFDLPLLRTRYLLNRRRSPFDRLHVLDLLVPVRRVWGRMLPDCRQQTLERLVCAHDRDGDDIDGACIPKVWFDYLAGGAPDDLARVLKHNEWDMTGMAAILGRVLDTARRLADDGRDRDTDWRLAWSLGRICEARGDRDGAIRWLTAAVAAAPDTEGEGLARRRFARDAIRILKRGGDWRALEKIIDEALTPLGSEPWLHREAAILHEHRLGDRERALAHALRCGEPERVTRLQRKLGGNGG